MSLRSTLSFTTIGQKIADFLDILCGVVSVVLVKTKTAITTGIAKCIDLARYVAVVAAESIGVARGLFRYGNKRPLRLSKDATTDDGVVNDDGVVLAESPATITIAGGKYIGKECIIMERLAVKVRIELLETGKVVDIMSTSLEGVQLATATTVEEQVQVKALRRSSRIQNMNKTRAKACALRRSPRLNKV